MGSMISVTNGHMRATLFGLMGLALVLAGCVAPSGGGEANQEPQAPAATSAPMATSASAPTMAPATAVPATALPVPAKVVTTTIASAPTAQVPMKPATVMVSKNARLGQILTDNDGRTLYLFTKDTKDASNCYDNCAAAWPPLLTAGAPVAGDGASASLLGTTMRKDGTTQVTYNGWPLYYYVKDQKAGDTTGQDVGKVWYVLSPGGEKIETTATAANPTSAPTAGPTAAATGTLVKLAKDDKLGSFLVDEQGKTLYLFTKDEKNISNCYDNCEAAWPVLFTTGAPRAGDGVNASLLGTTTRKDGKTQVTYNGWPLYYYVKDQKAGDTTGQGVGGVWFLISPGGEKVGAAAVAPKTTGGYNN